MAVYAIGDVQGCYSALLRLLDRINFDQSNDCLWFCGDLVNRGPQSLETLGFVKSLGHSAVTVLGNHDLHLLALYHKGQILAKTDTLYSVLNSPNVDELMTWLQSRPLLHYDEKLAKLLVHAGIHPSWSIAEALEYAGEVQDVLQNDGAKSFFMAMYGDQPDRWSDALSGMDRLRCITNIFTRLRFIQSDGRLDMMAKGGPKQHQALTPWFEVNRRSEGREDIVFGHWSTLKIGTYGKHMAIDCGCVWGGELVALQIDCEIPVWTSIKCER